MRAAGVQRSSRPWVVGVLVTGAVLLVALLFAAGDSLHTVSISISAPAAEGLRPASSFPAVEPQLPKVALMFMTRAGMPLRSIWGTFLSAAAALVDPAAAGIDMNSGDEPAPLFEEGWQRLFSLYIHPPPGFVFPEASEFSGHEVPGRVLVTWGHTTEASGHRALLRAALRDPLNQRFVMLSDSCVPIYPPAVVYATLMSEHLSRVSVCSHDDSVRYREGMLEYGVTLEHFRKSGQWTVLTRKHAEAVAFEDIVIAAFHKACQVESGFCLASEHYVPTVLAFLGLEAETDCGAVTTHARWEGGAHPAWYRADEASLATVEKMRGEACQQLQQGLNAAAKRAIAEALQRVQGRAGQERVQQLSGGGGTHSSSSSSSESAAAVITPPAVDCSGNQQDAVRQGFRLLQQMTATLNTSVLPSRCPLFARKISRKIDGVRAWAQVLEPVLKA